MTIRTFRSARAEISESLKAAAVRLPDAIAFVVLAGGTTHQHLCSNCRAVITLDEGGKCQRNVDHEDELCEACALTQPGLKETILTEAADQGDLGDPGRPPRQRSRDRQPHLADQPPADSALPSAGSVAKRTPSPGIPLSANTPIRLGGLIPAQCGEGSVGLFLRLRAEPAPVPSQNLKPDILMMKPAENWYCCDMADLLWAPKSGAFLSNERCVRTWL